MVTLVNGKEQKRGDAWGKTYKSILKMKKVHFIDCQRASALS